MLKRDFIKFAASSALACLMLQTTKTVYSQTIVLAEEDADALALGYKKDAAHVDPEKHPRFKTGQRCNICTWYRGDSQGAYGPCGMYPENKLVSSVGWCSAWMKRS